MAARPYFYTTKLCRGTVPGSRPKFAEGQVAMHVADRLFFVGRADGEIEAIPFDDVPASLRDALVGGWFITGKPPAKPAAEGSIMGAILKKLGLA